MGKEKQEYMGKFIGKSYIITQRCFYMIAQLSGMHEQQVFFALVFFWKPPQFRFALPVYDREKARATRQYSSHCFRRPVH